MAYRLVDGMLLLLLVNYTIKCNTFKKKRTLILNPVL